MSFGPEPWPTPVKMADETNRSLARIKSISSGLGAKPPVHDLGVKIVDGLSFPTNFPYDRQGHRWWHIVAARQVPVAARQGVLSRTARRQIISWPRFRLSTY